MLCRRPLRLLLGAAACGLVLVGVAAAESNPAAISPPDPAGPGFVGSAPVSEITVTGSPTIDRLSIMLNGFTHATPDDVDVEVIGPTGQRLTLMSDAGGENAVSNLDLTFDDVGNVLPDEGTLLSTVYQPANYPKTTSKPSSATEPDPDVFPLDPSSFRPTPSTPPPASGLGLFDGTNPNGTWSLYVVDDSTGSTGDVSGGWTVSINTIVSSVGVARFLAQSRGGSVALSWRTGSEAKVIGFNVFRSTKGQRTRVNGSLIFAKAGAKSAGYRLVDDKVRRGASYTYRLEAVRLDGSRAWAGTSALQVR